MKYVIACDHAGFGMKEAIRGEFARWGIELQDFGTHGPESVDYPDFARELAERVSRGEFDRGILICGSGVGMSIAANRYPDIRAALCFTVEMAELCRRHNNANVLVLPGRMIPIDQAVRMVRCWMDTPFDGGRHQSRLDKLAHIQSASDTRG